MEQSQTVYVPWSHWRLGGGILLNLHILSVTSVKWRNLSFAFIESKWEVANRKKPLKLWFIFPQHFIIHIDTFKWQNIYHQRIIFHSLDKGGMPNLPALMGDLEITQVPGWQSKQERKDVIRSATAGSPALLCRHVIELKSFFTKLGSLHIDKQSHGHKWNNHKTLLLRTSIICSGWRMGGGRWGPRLWSDKSAHQREHYTNVSARGKHFRWSSAQTIWKKIAQHFCQTTFISAILCES